MTKAELAGQVASQTGFSRKDSGKAVDAVFKSIAAALQSGAKVSLVGFGTFATRTRAARNGRNPQTNRVIKIAARRVPVFKPGKTLKETVRA